MGTNYMPRVVSSALPYTLDLLKVAQSIKKVAKENLLTGIPRDPLNSYNWTY